MEPDGDRLPDLGIFSGTVNSEQFIRNKGFPSYFPSFSSERYPDGDPSTFNQREMERWYELIECQSSASKNEDERSDCTTVKIGEWIMKEAAFRINSSINLEQQIETEPSRWTNADRIQWSCPRVTICFPLMEDGIPYVPLITRSYESPKGYFTTADLAGIVIDFYDERFSPKEVESLFKQVARLQTSEHAGKTLIHPVVLGRLKLLKRFEFKVTHGIFFQRPSLLYGFRRLTQDALYPRIFGFQM